MQIMIIKKRKKKTKNWDLMETSKALREGNYGSITIVAPVRLGACVIPHNFFR